MYMSNELFITPEAEQSQVLICVYFTLLAVLNSQEVKCCVSHGSIILGPLVLITQLIQWFATNLNLRHAAQYID